TALADWMTGLPARPLSGLVARNVHPTTADAGLAANGAKSTNAVDSAIILRWSMASSRGAFASIRRCVWIFFSMRNQRTSPPRSEQGSTTHRRLVALAELVRR